MLQPLFVFIIRVQHMAVFLDISGDGDGIIRDVVRTTGTIIYIYILYTHAHKERVVQTYYIYLPATSYKFPYRTVHAPSRCCYYYFLILPVYARSYHLFLFVYYYVYMESIYRRTENRPLLTC